MRGDALGALEVGRDAAVAGSVGYVDAVLGEQGVAVDPVGKLNPAAFLATAPDGRDVASLLDLAPAYARAGVSRGAAPSLALQQAGRWLSKAAATTLADTSREYVSADITARATQVGWVRMLNPPSCRWCLILAGRWYRWNEGFERHPECDCRHIPAPEDADGDVRTDPYAYFNGLSEAEQDRLLGRNDANAVRDGADIYRVVNIRNRGLGTAKSARKYGTPSRVTIDDIYAMAGNDRQRAIVLMNANGYITGEQVNGGNIFGRFYEGFGELGKGGAAGGARDAMIQARITGVRDPLNRYTMTAAERRLYDAWYRVDAVERTGFLPPSIGENSADKGRNPGVRATPDMRVELADRLSVQLMNVRRGTSRWRLAEALGLI